MKTQSFLVTGFLVACLFFFAGTLQSHAAIAYGIPAGTAGTQAYNGALGNDFDVSSPDGIVVTRLGVFDDGSNGLNSTITVGIFDRTTATLVGSSITFSGDDGSLEDATRFADLTSPISLPAGFQGSIVAQGYNGSEQNGNAGTGSTPGTTDDGDGAITFVGGSRFGPGGVFAYPTSVDGGPANRYHAGNFDFTITNVDSDNDGLPDHWETRFGLDPADPSDADDDGDGDGLDNLEEYENGTDPTERDSDGDNLSDGEEISEDNGFVTDPNNADTDGDGLNDDVETNTGTFVSDTDTGTDPNDADTDDDGDRDGAEIAAGSDPHDSNDGIPAPYKGLLAVDYLTGGIGTQSFGEGLGHDFVVNEPISVNALGVFDSGADGLGLELSAELWQRDDAGTPEVFNDDTGTQLATLLFTPGDPGFLHNSNRFKALPNPITLEPGAYTVVGRGYGNAERNGNEGTGGPRIDHKDIDEGDGLILFVGNSRFGGGGVGNQAFPASVDGGPPVRYSAGTFAYKPAQVDHFYLRITASGDDLVLEWDSKFGKVYDILSSTDLSATPVENWPVLRGDIPATSPLNTETILRPPDDERYFVVVEKDGPPLFEDDLETDKGWTAIVNDANGNTNWERGTPSGSTGPLTGADGSANAWSTNQGDYGPDSDISLRSPVIDLTGVPTADLSFDVFRDADGFGDTASVRFLDATGLIQLGFRQAIDMTVFDVDWSNLVIPVGPEALGQSIIIEINFISDNSADSFSGLSIDNIRLN